MNWAGNSDEIILLQLNRLQNTLNVNLGSAHTGRVSTILSERDEAWVDIDVEDIPWLADGNRFLWLSERDGWRHAYIASRKAGAEPRLITKDAFDVVSLEGVDEKMGWLYYIASPDNATQRYLYRTKLSGSGETERVSPAAQAGTHSYSIAPNASWAFHTPFDHQLAARGGVGPASGSPGCARTGHQFCRDCSGQRAGRRCA